MQNDSVTMALVIEVLRNRGSRRNANGARRRVTNPRIKFVIARNYPFGRAVRYTEL